MWKILQLKKALLALLTFFFIHGVAVSQQRELKQGIVKIEGYKSDVGSASQKGTGSCFYKSESGKLYVLTANHVVHDNGFPLKRIKVIFQGSDRDYEATIYRAYQGIDVAILALDAYPSNVRLLELGSSKDVEDFQKVYGWGYPGGGIMKAFQGTVSAPSEDKIFINNISLSQGNSGGPLLSMNTNKIIGVILQNASDNTNQYARAIDFSVLYLKSDHVLKRVFTSSETVSNGNGETFTETLVSDEKPKNFGEIINNQNGTWSSYINSNPYKQYVETSRDANFIYLSNTQVANEFYALPHYGGMIQFKNQSTNNQWEPLLTANLAYRNPQATHYLTTSDGSTWFNYENGTHVRTYSFLDRNAYWVYINNGDDSERIALPINGGRSEISNSMSGFQYTPLLNFQQTVVTYTYEY